MHYYFPMGQVIFNSAVYTQSVGATYCYSIFLLFQNPSSQWFHSENSKRKQFKKSLLMLHPVHKNIRPSKFV